MGLAAVGGLLAEVVTTATNGSGAVVSADWSTGLMIGLIFYFISYYLARFTWYRGVNREGQGKVYSTGIGGFILVFLFAWILLFTLQAAGY